MVTFGSTLDSFNATARALTINGSRSGQYQLAW